ncbi:MAG: S-formylglutathione hydrolase FrmB [Planctomycetota bacterium]|jgi:S-formylglutathione hydrolase FrmB
MRSKQRVRRPEKTGNSRFEWVTIPRSILGCRRSFGVYLPVDYGTSTRGYPTLYLFRGAEREWAGSQDGREGLKRILDGLIESGKIEPMIVVLPGFMEPSGRTQGVPLDWLADGSNRGVGNGRFERHFFEIKDIVESRFAVRIGRRHAALDGFSMGGFSSMYLGLKYPALFGSVGSYDGSFMWPSQIDPRLKPFGRACKLWMSETCAPYFCGPTGWDIPRMERANPITWVTNATGNRLRLLRDLKVHMRTAGSEVVGNVDRCYELDEYLEYAGIANTFRDQLIFDKKARHDWSWADRHLNETILLHDQVFRSIG